MSNIMNQPDLIGSYARGQQIRMRENAMDRQQTLNEREDTAYDEAKEYENLRYLFGSTQVLKDIWEANPGDPRFYAAAAELGTEGIERGALSPDDWDPNTVTYERVVEFNDAAKVDLAGRPSNSQMGAGATNQSLTSPQRNYYERQHLVEMFGEGSDQVKTFDSYVRAGKIYTAGGVPTKDTPSGQVALSTQGAELDFASREAAAKVQGERAGGAVDLTPAELEIDKKFAAEYNDFMLGGFADAEKGVAQLGGVLNDLQRGQYNLTGWRVASTPDWAKVVTDPEALNARDLVEEVVQRNLRLILGAQFTENEGKRLIARAYNPALEEKYNIARVERLIKSMTDGLSAKQSAADYFQTNGTLKGWTGAADVTPKSKEDVTHIVDSLIQEMDTTSGALAAAQRAIAQGADPVAVRNRLQQMGIDPSGL